MEKQWIQSIEQISYKKIKENEIYDRKWDYYVNSKE